MPDLYRFARPILRRLPAETAHRLSLCALGAGLVRMRSAPADAALTVGAFGLTFANPLGLAAGFDKDAEAVDAALRLGFGFVEAGTVTPRPQPGNPRPRLFRLEADEAVVNRLGFNSGGLDRVAARLAARRARGAPGIVGANLGKNRETAEAADDYAEGAARLAPLVDYLVVNVSSPNTPGLRALQRREALSDLVARVMAARDRAAPDRKPPLLVKIAPDLSPEERADIAAVALETGIDGLIIGNTTVQRPAGLKDPKRDQQGGLSGRPLFALSTEILADFYRLTEGRLPLVGCGGVSSGADAYGKIRAGASLVQLYTALVFHGPKLVGDILRELAERLRADGFANVSDAVGADHR